MATKEITDNIIGGISKLLPRTESAEEIQKKQCVQRGGRWDEKTKTCIMPQPQPQPQSPEEKEPTKVLSNPTNAPIVTDRFGNETLQLQDQASIEARRNARPIGGTSKEQLLAQDAARAEGKQLAGQVGQFDQLGTSPTGLDFEQALRVGVVDAIPSAIKTAGQLAAGGAVLGGAIGTAAGPLGTGGGAVLGAAIGGATGFVSGLASSMKSDMAGQRRDTTTAQQRVLDEGKQTMNDWVTMAEGDPANRAQYLTEFNKVAAQIDQAYRQMKLDTSLDVARFETALPNLAEFEAFYAAGGERDVLTQDMRNALTTVSPENYRMIELANRRST